MDPVSRITKSQSRLQIFNRNVMFLLHPSMTIRSFPRGIWHDVRILEQSFPRCQPTKHCLPETVKPQLMVCEAETINIKCSPYDSTLRTLFLPVHFPVYLLMNLNTSYFSLGISAVFRAHATFHQWANSWASGAGGGVPCLLWEIILT